RPPRVNSLRALRSFDHAQVVFSTALLTLEGGDRVVALRTLNLREGAARTFRLDEHALAMLENAIAEARQELSGEPRARAARWRRDDEPRPPGVPRGTTFPR